MSSLKLVKPGCFGFGTNAHTHTHAYIQAQTCMLYPYTHELLYAFMSCKRCTHIFVLFFGDFLFWRPPCFVCQVCVGEVEGWRCCGSGVHPSCVGLCTSEKTALKKTTNTLQIKVVSGLCVYKSVCVSLGLCKPSVSHLISFPYARLWWCVCVHVMVGVRKKTLIRKIFHSSRAKENML